MLCAPILSQEAAIEALMHGESDVAHMREQYMFRRNFIVNSLNEMGMPCHSPRGAFYVFPSVTHLGLASKDFAVRLLEQQRVAVVPGTAFGSCGEGYVRCSYATNIDQIEIAMKRMRDFMESLETTSAHVA